MDNSKKQELIKKVNKVIDSIRPYLISDGGDVTVVDITDDMTVKVKLTGACQGCPFSMMTLKSGIEQTVKEKIPEVKEVIAVD
ncbi:MAG: NifU family protein [Bacteroidales bacterium]|nr:MAG: NifU family protein [Bacteroidales bacterium]